MVEKTTKIKDKAARLPIEPEEQLVDATRQYTLEQTTTPSKPNTEFLPLNTSSTEAKGVSVQDIVLSELQAARLLNLAIPDDPQQFIPLLEDRIREATGTRKNIILILDEESGTYTCLNDETNDSFAAAPRELTWISDHYLQDLLGSDKVMHSFLHHQGNIIGIIAIAEKQDGSAFTLRDEIILEQLTQYLSVQVNHYLLLKRTMALPTIQKILLQISNRLLAAVDSPAIFQSVFTAITEALPFHAGQYIELNGKTGKGHVLYQMSQSQFQQGQPLKEVDQFVSLLSLFQSQVWRHPYLYLKSEMLGDKSFSDLFGLKDIVSVLVLPLIRENNQIDGALVLFQQKEASGLSKDALKVLEQVSELVVSACSRAQVLEKALEIATTDELTGAVNRRGFYSRFDAEVDRARRNHTSMCLALLDLDHFKLVNDTYGHLTGDAILKHLAQMIQKNCRKSDLLCRFGGEEFALLLPETTMHAAVDLIERLRRKVEKQLFSTPGGSIKITFSAGIDLVDTHEKAPTDAMKVISEALANADEALYEAKQLGRNRIVIVE